MDKLRSVSTIALMAGLVAAAYWMVGPGPQSTNAMISGAAQPIVCRPHHDCKPAKAALKTAACRPHDDCARMARRQRPVTEASMGP